MMASTTAKSGYGQPMLGYGFANLGTGLNTDTGLFGYGVFRSRFVYHSSVSMYRYALCIMIKGMSKISIVYIVGMPNKCNFFEYIIHLCATAC